MAHEKQLTWEEFKLTWPAFTEKWQHSVIAQLDYDLFGTPMNTLDTLQALKWATIFIRKMETDPIYAIALAGYFRERPEELDALRSIQNGVTEYLKKAAEQEQ